MSPGVSGCGPQTGLPRVTLIGVPSLLSRAGFCFAGSDILSCRGPKAGGRDSLFCQQKSSSANQVLTPPPTPPQPPCSCSQTQHLPALAFTFFKIRLLICLFLTVLGLRCCTQTFSSCGERGLLCCGAWASHCGGFSCGTWALGCQASVVVVCRLSCPVTCGILVPGPETEPVSHALAGGFLTSGPPGKSPQLLHLLFPLLELFPISLLFLSVRSAFPDHPVSKTPSPVTLFPSHLLHFMTLLTWLDSVISLSTCLLPYFCLEYYLHYTKDHAWSLSSEHCT